MKLFRKKKQDTEQDEVLDILQQTPAEEVEEVVKVDHSDRYVLFAIIFEILMGLFVYLKSTVAFNHYVIFLAPLIVITGFLGNHLYQKNANMKLFRSICYLITIGIGLQTTIDVYYNTSTNFDIIKYFIAFFIAVIFIIFYSYFRMFLKNQITVYVMIFLAAAIYLYLYFFGYDPNGYGTSAWISVAGYTVEMTDFTKVIALLFYSALFSSKTKNSENLILLLSSIFFGINLLGSVMIHELGSFFILFFLHLGLLFIFMEHSKKKDIYLLSIVGVCIGALGICYVLYKVLYPSYSAGTLSGIASYIWPYAKKVYERFSITANIYNDPYGAGYQLLQGKKALWVGGLFGNTVNFHSIPVASSDMAFVVLVCEYGWILAAFTLYHLTSVTFHAGKLARKLLRKNQQDAIVAFGAGYMLFMQAMLVILGSCNLIPFTGLPIPFLSRGFTYLTITFCFVGTLLHLSKEEEEVDDGSINVTEQ